MSTIEIRGRTYTVERKAPSADRDSNVQAVDPGQHYVLTGARASYFTVRNVPNPSLMFLVRDVGSGKSLAGQMSGVWLTDKNGTLEVVR